MTYLSNECTDLVPLAFGGSEAFHRKVGWPPLLMVENKMVSRKMDRNRLRASYDLLPVSGLSSVRSPSSGHRKINSRQTTDRPRTHLDLSSSPNPTPQLLLNLQT